MTVEHKIQVSRQTKEDVGGIMYPATGTGARMVWDEADKAHAEGKTSSDVIEGLTKTTTMTPGTVSSQLTYWRKATGKDLAKRAAANKAEKDAAKAAEKAKREADRAAKKAAKEQEDAVKAAAKLAKLQEQAAKLQAAQTTDGAAEGSKQEGDAA